MTTKKKTTQENDQTSQGVTLCCSLPEVQEFNLGYITNAHRLNLIETMDKVWTNGVSK